jgi:hypothetical protein
MVKGQRFPLEIMLRAMREVSSTTTKHARIALLQD